MSHLPHAGVSGLQSESSCSAHQELALSDAHPSVRLHKLMQAMQQPVTTLLLGTQHCAAWH